MLKAKYYYYYYYYCHRCRGRTARLLESGSPTLHAVICLLIVLDAAIIVAQIFMDMHAVRSQYINSRLSLSSTFCRETDLRYATP